VPSRTIGRATMRLMPTMATSGWLMTGVDTMPPSLPRLVTVSVEPDSSSRVALPARALAARLRDGLGAVPQVQRLRLPQHRHHQAAVGLRGHAQVHRVKQRQHAGLVVEAAVDLRKVGHRAHDGADGQRQRRQFAARHRVAGGSAPRAAPPSR
jgi:hypothetical protein